MRAKTILAFLILTIIEPVAAQEKNSWPEIYKDDTKSYWQKSEKFYEWFESVNSEEMALDSIIHSPYYKKFRRFEANHSHKLDKEGTFDSYNAELLKLVNNSDKSSSSNCAGNDWDFASFSEVPPNSHWCKGMGIITDLWVNPSNHQHLLAASRSGGLWKTIDGGANWTNTTESLGIPVGVSTIAVDPTNSNVIYIGTGSGKYETEDYGLGVFKSTNGGITWSPTSVTFNAGEFSQIRKILIDPSNTSIIHVIAYREWHNFTPNGYYRSTNGLQSHTFQYIFNPFDIVLKPGNSQQVTIISRNGVHKSTNGGVSFQNFSINVLSKPSLTCINFAKFAVDENNPNVLAVLYIPLNSSCSGLSGSSVVDRSYDGGGSWTHMFNHGGSVKEGFQFSKNDPNVLYVGDILLKKYRKVNGVLDPIKIMNVDRVGMGSNHDSWMHSDIRTLTVLDDNGVDKLYVGHDGGVSVSNYQCNNDPYYDYCWTSLNGSGLTNTMYHGIGIHEHDPNVFYGGAQDGNGAYTKNAGTTWTAGMLTDAGDVLIHDNTSNKRALMDWGRPYFYASNGTSLVHSNGNAGSFQSRFEILPRDRNTVYFGTNHFSKYTFSTDQETRLMNVVGVSPSRGGIVNDFSICERDPNSMVVATNKNRWGSTDFLGSLFKTNVPNPDEITDWSDITPEIPALDYGRIAAVEQDPNNPDRIWIGVSGFSNFNANQRIYYTSTGGTNRTVPSGWIEFGAGLPNLPIQEIKYQLGTNDLLYAATDAGVFYRNATMSQWECMNSNLAPGVANDLDISYCTGKMAVSIYGRGAYKNDLLNIPWDITSNTTWDEKRWLSVDLHIKSGVTLTIKDSLLIYPNAKIIVERGGKLIVDGGVLTTTCSERLWSGIQVYGNSSQSQYTPLKQGEVRFINGAILENAIVGISAIKTNDDGTQDWNYTGGIIKGASSTFRNCKKAAAFYSYNNTQSGTTYSNLSFFSNCTFETTSSLKDNTNPTTFVSLYDVDGINFNSCTFRNTAHSLYTEANRGNGITTWDATFNVSPTCSVNNSQPCPLGSINKSNFNNLTYGIDARGINSLHPFNVDHANFNNCIKGIFQSGLDYTSITRSSFLVPTSNSGLDCYGVYLEESNNYLVQENYFSSSNTSNNSGISVYKSGGYANEIYNNNFSNLHAGALIMEENGVKFTASEGLELICNDFSENNFAIALTQNGVINYNQGDGTDPAGNTFSPDCNSGSTQELHVSNNSFDFEYYHHTSILCEPLCHNPSKVLLVQTGVSYENKESACPSNLDPFCPACPTEGALGRMSGSSTSDEKKVRMYFKDTLLDNGLNNITELLLSKELTNRSQKTILNASLRLNDENYLNSINDDNLYLDVIKWYQKNGINSGDVSELVAFSDRNDLGRANARNLLYLIEGKSFKETIVYPKQVQERKAESKLLDSDNFTLYPNPAINELSVSFNFTSETDRNLIITDSKGNSVIELQIQGGIGIKVIDISNLASGLYYIKLIEEAAVLQSKKFVIAR